MARPCGGGPAGRRGANAPRRLLHCRSLPHQFQKVLKTVSAMTAPAGTGFGARVPHVSSRDRVAAQRRRACVIRSPNPAPAGKFAFAFAESRNHEKKIYPGQRLLRSSGAAARTGAGAPWCARDTTFSISVFQPPAPRALRAGAPKNAASGATAPGPVAAKALGDAARRCCFLSTTALAALAARVEAAAGAHVCAMPASARRGDMPA